MDEEQFHNADWTSFYPDAKEPIPLHVPPPRGNQVLISCFMDEYHAGNHATRRSNTWILIFCYCAPIIWYSKRQNTMETSSFGSEFIALRIAVELIEALRFKLWMIGLPVKGPHNVYCDNKWVVTNAALPESTLSKKRNSIAYHKVREAVAACTTRIGKKNRQLILLIC